MVFEKNTYILEIMKSLIHRLKLFSFSLVLCFSLFAGWLIYSAYTQALNITYLPFTHQIDFEQVRSIRDGYSGVALFDYDNDGDLDIYLTNGPGYRNALLENGPGGFHNVAVRAGVNDVAGLGAVSGDIDNDGFDDLFVADLNGSTLYRNLGHRTFDDITDKAGVRAENQLAYSAAFCDFDNDGLLDLYVGTSRQGPLDQPFHNLFFHNQGDLRFVEVSEQAGVGNPVTRMTVSPEFPLLTLSWAVACFDYDLDGDSDILVAVDFSTVTLFHNQWQERGTLTFSNRTLDAGLGAVGNWMGLAVADYNADGWPDVFVTNWGNSPLYPINPVENFPVDTVDHALYLNSGDGTFTDHAAQAGVADWEIGWGTSPLDWDNDGDMDLYFAGNYAEAPGEGFAVLDNPGRLFLNDGDANFREVSKEYGLLNLHPDGGVQNAHGVAIGDLNDDGFTDIVVANSAYHHENNVVSGAPIFFQNNAESDNHWIKFKLTGTQSNRNGIGAKVTIRSGGLIVMQEVRSGSSHLSQDSQVLTFGLGKRAEVDQIEIHWPSGETTTMNNVSANQTIIVIEAMNLP